MATEALLNYLQLCFPPISNYDFAVQKNIKVIQGYLNQAHIYIIAQRPVLTFENLTFNSDFENPMIFFNIKQRGNEEILTCQLPIYQEKLSVQIDPFIKVMSTFANPKPQPIPQYPPFNGLANFKIIDSKGRFYWLSPESILFYYWNETLDVKINGDIKKFLNYAIHYVGKSTDQDMIKRLTGHSHLQDILSLEQPLQVGSLPTDEVVLLLFNFFDNFHMYSYGIDDDDNADKYALDLMMGRKSIEKKTIYLDAEKALIHLLKPKHNRQYYNQYPKSKDGLMTYNLEGYTYAFRDPIRLKFKDGEICGSLDFNRADHICIGKDEAPIIIKNNC